MASRLLVLMLPILLGMLLALPNRPRPVEAPLPYAEAGLTEREAAAYLLSRFTFGARPGDVDHLVTMGLETWLDHQLRAAVPDPAVERIEERLQTTGLTAVEIAATYPNPGLVLRRLAQEQGMDREALQNLPERERREALRGAMEASGQRPQRDLIGELIGQKVARAVYSENQLQEVLTDFWFNHFNVSLHDNQARVYVLPYERDAIRPHVLGSFRDLLGATARHPAMLLYLDNAQSTAPEGVPTTMEAHLAPLENQRGLRGRIARNRIQEGRERMEQEQQEAMQTIPEEFRPRHGINENYARELLELHTLGVDGGYTQADVEAVARAFTGWTLLPAGPRGDRLRERFDRRGEQAGFVLDGSFLFRADAHDATEKTILGAPFPAGGGMDEGERVLDLIAAHPSTVRHLARKLAVRFVADAPPQALIDDLAEVFLTTNGDLRAMTRALAYSPHFWSAQARRAKIKSPFGLAVSALRALNAEVRPTRDLINWIEKMGQPLYRYQAPTGFPDTADYWLNAGALLNRMNFGLHLAAGRIDGVRVDLPVLNQNREPESIENALATYLPLLLPEQATDGMIAPLLPMASDPNLAERLAATTDDGRTTMEDGSLAMDNERPTTEERGASTTDPGTLARVVGVILGSPDFQRR